MAPSLLLLFNHQITDRQVADAHKTLKVSRILEPPEDLKTMWGCVPPGWAAIDLFLQAYRNWIAETAEPGDYLLVQGDFGAVYLMVQFAFESGLVPIYSTTVRRVDETRGPDGAVRLTHTFKHCRFRRYGD